MSKAGFNNEIIWIIGASSGIGRALCLELAHQGARLMLSARRHDALKHLQAELAGQHEIFTLDVTDADMTLQTVRAIFALTGRIDRVVYLSAAYTPMRLGELDLDVTRTMIDINLMGAFHIIHAILPVFKQQSCGQIALCSSVAAYTGLPNGQPYSATKAALSNLAESLYAESDGRFDVKLISPGFVRTAMTEKNDFSMPMIMTPEQAARQIAKGLRSGKFEIHFPKRLTFILKFLRWLPYRLSLSITRRL